MSDTNTFESPLARDRMKRLLYIIGKEGDNGIRRLELAERARIPADTTYTYCNELRRRGLIHVHRVGNDQRWRCGVGRVQAVAKLPRERAPVNDTKQSTVSTWTPHHERDPLVAFLFGGV